MDSPRRTEPTKSPRSPTPRRNKVLALVGPTAVGKTRVSLVLARAMDAEVVSADSMQVYRGLDIGTDKPSKADRGLVAHHLLDIRDPWEPFTVAEYQEVSRRAIADITSRGWLPLLVGGSGLYVRAAVDDFEFPPGDTSGWLRRQLEEKGRREGPEALHAQLAGLDPTAAQRIPAANVRRVIRALEVISSTGEPFSAYQDRWAERRTVYNLAIVGLTMPREILCAKIDQRVDEQVGRGLVAEVSRLVDQGLGPSLTARQALGYRQILSYLEGRLSLDDALAELRRKTKQYAKRQMTWFKADPRIHWFEAQGKKAEDLAEEIREYLIGVRWIRS